MNWQVSKISKDDCVVIVCDHGAFRSRYAYNLMAEKDYSHIDYGGVSQLSLRRLKAEMLKKANVIISVHPYITASLESKYNVGSHQRLIELDVPDLNFNRGLRSVYGDLEEQIIVYLSE